MRNTTRPGGVRGTPVTVLCRSGLTPKTELVGLDRPKDRNGSFTSRLVPTGERRLGGLDDMIISPLCGWDNDP